MPARGYETRKFLRRKRADINYAVPGDSACLRTDRKNKIGPLREYAKVRPVRETSESCPPYWEGREGDGLRKGFAWRGPCDLRKKPDQGWAKRFRYRKRNALPNRSREFEAWVGGGKIRQTLTAHQIKLVGKWSLAHIPLCLEEIRAGAQFAPAKIEGP